MIGILVKNELRKLLRRSKTWIIFGLFIAALLLIGVGDYFSGKSMEKYNSPEFKIENINNEVEYIEKDYLSSSKDLQNKDPEKYEQMTNRVNDLKNEKTSLENAIKDPSKSKDLWKVQLDGQIKDIENQLKDDTMPERYKGQMKTQLTQLNYLKDNNIKPINEWELNSYNYLKSVMQILGVFLLGIGIALFMSDIVSGECTPATLKFLLIQPISRGKVILSKFIAVCITSVTMILSTEILGFIIIGLFKGFGNSNYPMTIGTKFQYDLSKIEDGIHPLIEIANSTTMISLSQFTLRSFLLQALYIIACCSFVFMVSSLVKSSMTSMAIATSVLIACNIFNTAFAFFRKISFLLFTSFGTPSDLLTGQIAIFYNKPFITLGFGIIVMLCWIVGCYLIAHFIFKKKDILI
ncbi:ABC transporter permease subunit [Clostridium frigidicarnis]|uniref:ABC-2 type transport system permease protein n=1 Tax=Clostridium frigidicarnis TaxID=84698 RepID=A0A1I0W5Y3_9CLOT|nr:ABC transporter permease [Clostridium frigidicarnis]SFA83326.1 ABC-2 type transport system permease protein [Clostridium frigidicarnis]